LKTFTILNIDGKFWNGYKFVSEYPEARLFQRLPEARAVASVIARRQPARVYADYGLDSQAVIVSVGA
jgi:hypothetical protein